MPGADLIEGLLADLQTITDVSRAGVISRRQWRLEPGEIRPAAVLFLDMVGFTPLTRRIGAEQVTLLIDRTFRIFELTVQAHGGYQTGFGGDAANYLFAGHPNYAPVCEAALRAALKLKERIRQINESLAETGLSLSFRIGVSFGEVTLKAVGSAGAKPTIMGEAINLAQRLESISAPGSVTTTQAVLEKAGDVFASTPLGERELKGVGKVMTYEVGGADERPAVLRGAYRQLTPLVGRSQLLEQAADRVEAWLATRHDPSYFDLASADTPLTGHNRLLLLSGVGAIGKSRLAYELVQRIRAARPLVSATVQCTERSNLRSYTAELARVAGLDAKNLPARWQELLASASDAVSPEYAERQRRHLPLLAHVLGCEQVDSSAIGQMDVDSFETACQLAGRACCELAAHQAGAPVLLVIEDLQWLGEIAGALADLLAHACLPWPLIAVATARPQYQHAAGALGEGEACTLELTPLTDADGDALLQALLPGLSLPDQLRAELHEKAAGIPYYYEEFARMLERRGLVIARDGRYVLAHELEELDVPEDVCALILGRLDQLTPELKELAMRASVLGRRFPFSLLAAVEAELGLEQGRDLKAELQTLVGHRILAAEPGDRYFFVHVLLREAAYGALLKRNRRLLHAAAARVLTELYVPGSIDEVQQMSNRAQHLYHAGQYNRALDSCGKLLLIKARSGSFDNWDYWEQLAGRCQAKGAGSGDGPQPSYALLRARGVKLMRQGDYTGSYQLIEEALAAARDAANEAGVAAALCDLGILSRRAGRAEEALQLYQRALHILELIHDHQMEVAVLGNIGNYYYRKGYVNLAVAHFERGLAISQEHGDKRSEALMYINMALPHLEHGDSEEAMGLYKLVLELARETGNHVYESLALSNLGITNHSLGNRDEARQLWQQAVAIDREIRRREGEAINLFNLGELAYEEEDLEPALLHFEQCSRLFREQNNGTQTSVVLAKAGQVLARLGRLPEAAAKLEEASTLYGAQQAQAEMGVIECCWVYYDAATGNRSQAQSRIETARRLAQEIKAGTRTQLALEIERADRWLDAAAAQN